MEAKHTEGPWTAHPTAVLGACHTLICSTRNEQTLTDEEMAANARLIAAAPDMLTALRELAKAVEPFAAPVTEFHMPALEKARAVIARAEGGEA